MAKTFKCAYCGKLCEKPDSDEEALAELKNDFTGWSVEECDEVCHACYLEFMAWYRTDEVTAEGKSEGK